MDQDEKVLAEGEGGSRRATQVYRLTFLERELCHFGFPFTIAPNWMIWREIQFVLLYHCLWASRFLFSMERTSEVNLKKKSTEDEFIWDDKAHKIQLKQHHNKCEVDSIQSLLLTLKLLIWISELWNLISDLRASRTGKRLSRAVSLGSLNQDLMGIALSEKVIRQIGA